MVNPSVMLKANIGLHCFQGVWSIVIMGVVGAGMAADGPASGAARFMFTMCWLNIPNIIYLTMSPRFARTKNFAHPYWMLGMNSLYSIFWFAAFIALSVYTNNGISAGESKEKDENLKKQGGCAVFPAGTGEASRACELNKSAVGLAVVMWFLWLATTGIAGYASWYYKQHTISPFDDLATPSHEIQETTKDAFSSNDEYAPINRHGGGGGHHDEYEDDELESLSRGGRSASVISSSYNGSSAYSHEQAHPGRPLSWAAEREPYAGIGGHAPIAPAHGEAAMPEAHQDYSYRGARE